MILYDSYFLTIQIQWYNREQCRQFFPVGSKWVFWKQLNWMVAWHLTITFEIIYILLIISALEAISMPGFVPSYLNVQHYFRHKKRYIPMFWREADFYFFFQSFCGKFIIAYHFLLFNCCMRFNFTKLFYNVLNDFPRLQYLYNHPILS